MKTHSLRNIIIALFLATISFSCATDNEVEPVEEQGFPTLTGQAIETCICEAKQSGGVPIIFDSDFAPDYDDVGAIAMLHALADSGKVNILGTIVSNKHEISIPALRIFNNYFKRPNIPIGEPKSDGVSMTTWQKWAEHVVQEYPSTSRTPEEVYDAVQLYRKLLSSQPDNSVTILTVGFLTNLKNLLQSQPDGISNLNGMQLVTKKVKRLVAMAGTFPKGREFNVYKHASAAQYAFHNWPTEIIFSGFEVGANVRTGRTLINNANIVNSPVKDAYIQGMLKTDKEGRPSWDQTAVLAAVYQPEQFFNLKRGKITINGDGTNTFSYNSTGKHYHLVNKLSLSSLAAYIEKLMMHQPM